MKINRSPLQPGYIRVAPGRTIFIAAIIGLSLFAATLLSAISGPWLGVRIAPAQQGIVVVEVHPDGPNARRLSQGDIIVAVRGDDGVLLPITSRTLITTPHDYATYSEFNSFFSEYSALYAQMVFESPTLVLASGKEVEVKLQQHRPLSNLPLLFWVLSTIATLVLMVGAAVWVFRPKQTATRLVLLSALGYALGLYSYTVFATREWLLAPSLFYWSGHVTQAGDLLYAYTSFVLLWYFPRPLGRFPMFSTFMMLCVMLALNGMFQIVEWPLHIFDFPFYLPFLASIVFAACQLYTTRNQPGDRAALLWITHSLLLSSGVIFILFFSPRIFGYSALIPTWAAQLLVLVFFFGVVLGVIRYRLFDLDRWWFTIWSWFFGGLLVILCDLLLVTYAGFNQTTTLPVLLLALGWLYFPARQWLWGHLVRTPSQKLEIFLPRVLETLFTVNDNRTSPERWMRLLDQLFEPLNISTETRLLREPQIEEGGLVLALPTIATDQHIRMTGRNRGKRLFNMSDLQLAALLYVLTGKLTELREAQERGAAIERERIARDLHDDVAPQLLTLAHRADSAENAQRATAAMQTLRESIYALSGSEGMYLETMIAEWRIEAFDRVEAAGVELSWNQTTSIADIPLTLRQQLNLTRVLREALSNALRHARPSHITIDIALNQNSLEVSLRHDGTLTRPDSWRTSKGISNMRARISELGGRIVWRLKNQESVLEQYWQVPLTD